MLVPKNESLFGMFSEKRNPWAKGAFFYILIVTVQFPFQSLSQFLSHQQCAQVPISPSRVISLYSLPHRAVKSVHFTFYLNIFSS